MARKEKYISASKDGRYVRLQIRKDGHSVSKQFKVSDYGTQARAVKAAVAYRDDILAQIRQGVFADHSGKTFKEVFEELPSVIPKRVSTYDKYRKLYHKYMTSLSDIMIEDVTAADITAVLNKMVSIASDDTIGRVFSIIKHVFKAARIKHYVVVNVTEEVIVPKSEYRIKHRTQEVSSETLAEVIDVLESTGKYQTDKTIWNRHMIAQAILTITYTGIRPAEAFALTRNDIDLVKKKIHIQSELGSSYTSANTVREPKTELSDRYVPIPDELMSIITDTLSSHQYSFVFPDYSGDHMDMQKVRGIIYCLSKKYNLNFSMYQLRHQFSTDLIRKQKADPRTVQELMGHEHYTMSIDYARSSNEAKEKVISERSSELHEKLHEEIKKPA